MFAPEILTPSPLYRGRHRGDPRKCDVCRKPETAHPDSPLKPFFDPGQRRPRSAPRVVRGRHKRPGPVLEGP